MTRRLDFLTTALENLADIAAYIGDSSGNRDVANFFIASLKRQCLKLAELSAMLGRARSEIGLDVRSLAYGNYVIYFRYRDDVVEIIAILERHRDAAAHFNKHGSD